MDEMLRHRIKRDDIEFTLIAAAWPLSYQDISTDEITPELVPLCEKLLKVIGGHSKDASSMSNAH